MKQRIFSTATAVSLIAIMLLSVTSIPAASVSAASVPTEAITQKLYVTALVPHHRDIIIDYRGDIIEIVSNTTKDVTPDVYLMEVADANKRPLTAELLHQYRSHVPEGSGNAGVLYQRGLPLTLLGKARFSWQQT